MNTCRRTPVYTEFNTIVRNICLAVVWIFIFCVYKRCVVLPQLYTSNQVSDIIHKWRQNDFGVKLTPPSPSVISSRISELPDNGAIPNFRFSMCAVMTIISRCQCHHGMPTSIHVASSGISIADVEGVVINSVRQHECHGRWNDGLQKLTLYPDLAATTQDWRWMRTDRCSSIVLSSCRWIHTVRPLEGSALEIEAMCWLEENWRHHSWWQCRRLFLGLRDRTFCSTEWL